MRLSSSTMKRRGRLTTTTFSTASVRQCCRGNSPSRSEDTTLVRADTGFDDDDDGGGWLEMMMMMIIIIMI